MSDSAHPIPLKRVKARPLTSAEKDELTSRALGLMNEQLHARIVHYRADLETNEELDAITAQVVAQLKGMQQAAMTRQPEQVSPQEIETGQIGTMTDLLARVFGQDEEANLITRNLKPVGRRVAKLFFESELHEKTKGNKEKRIYHAEQGIYYILTRYKHRISTELEGFDYVDGNIRELTFDLLAKLERDMQVAFLSRRSPELNRVMNAFTSVLIDFFQKHLPPRARQMATITVRNAGTARHGHSVPYKIHSDCFDGFRQTWERLLMEQMIHYCGDGLIARLESDEDHEDVRDETLRFFTDPHVYSETCEVLCAALYDYLCLEGFLDLPLHWRVQLEAQRTETG